MTFLIIWVYWGSQGGNLIEKLLSDLNLEEHPQKIACHFLELIFQALFFNIFEKNSSPKKLNGPKNSTIFQAKTQRTGSNSSHMNFKTHFIFSTFAVNEQKSTSIRAKRAKKCHIWCIFTQFSTKNSHFFKKLTLNLQNFRVFE